MNNSEKKRDRTSSDPFLAERLNYLLSRQNASQSYGAEMAKWILASLIAINGAPFLIISKDHPEYGQGLLHSAGYFLSGISLALICGFLAWLNTGMREVRGSLEVDRLLTSSNSPSRGEVVANWITNASYTCSIVAGFGSLIVFWLGVKALLK